MTEQDKPLAPYHAETRAKGWRFELDHERIMQSDTWALTPADVRPWLLMIWMVSWQQTPCGSLPANDELIAARIGMDPATFKAKRHLLMRGWWEAADGRLYHDVIVLRVQEMMTKRKSESDRKALARSRAKAAQTPTEPHTESDFSDDFVPYVSHGTTMGIPGQSAGVTTPVPVPVPEPVITKEQCVGIPAPTHTIPDSFKAEIQKTRPDLDPEIVWGVFVQKTNPRDQVMAVWKAWVARERAPAVKAPNPQDPLSDPDSKASIELLAKRKGLPTWDSTKEHWHVFKARVLSHPTRPVNSTWTPPTPTKTLPGAANAAK